MSVYGLGNVLCRTNKTDLHIHIVYNVCHVPTYKTVSKRGFNRIYIVANIHSGVQPSTKVSTRHRDRLTSPAGLLVGERNLSRLPSSHVSPEPPALTIETRIRTDKVVIAIFHTLGVLLVSQTEDKTCNRGASTTGQLAATCTGD